MVNPCEKNLCENEAVCVADLADFTYTCKCDSGFVGKYCEIGKFNNPNTVNFLIFWFITY